MTTFNETGFLSTAISDRIQARRNSNALPFELVEALNTCLSIGV
jgi:hypothetical protein